MKKQLIWILILILIFQALFSACNNTPEAPSKTIVQIPPKVLSLAGKDAAGMCENFEYLANRNQLYCETQANGSDGISVTILESEREAWKDAILKSYYDMIQQSNAEDSNQCRVEIAEDYRSISSYIHPNESSLNIAYYVLLPELDCAYLQIFSGVKPDEWYVEINIYNAETGKFVIQGNSNEELKITDADWEASK